MSDAPIAYYEEGLRTGVLRYQHCLSCAASIFYPRVLCPACGAGDPGWQDSAGLGKVYSTTTVRPRSGDPYNVSLIDLDEGFRMMSRVVGDVDEVRIGQTVSFSVQRELQGAGEQSIAVFNRIEESR